MQAIISFLGGLALGICIIYPQVSKSENYAKSLEFSYQVCNSQLTELKAENRGMIINRD